jgi:murein L,D-transpeptidase YcbB/YkuD
MSAGDAALLLKTLRSADAQGLQPDTAALDRVRGELASTDPAEREAGLARLRAQAIAYARAQHGLRLPSDRFPHDWGLRPAPYDAAAEFDRALAGGRLADWLSNLPPPFPAYGRLVLAYGRYRAIVGQGGWPSVPTGPSLKPGATGARVEALRRRLAVEDGTVPPGPEPDSFDQGLAEAVMRAQARYGLITDGIAGPATLAALNVPADERLMQIGANLERWRWVPRYLAPDRVEVNIAAAMAVEYAAGAPALTTRIVVGRPGWPTPSFRDAIESIVFHPPWNVPPKIAAKEVWPKIRRIPGYMRRERFVVRPNGQLQQLPGPKSALGLIKFNLPNPYGVYLHDTPSKSLFAKDFRAQSHGCMRVEKPVELAKRLLRDDAAWPEARIDEELASGGPTLEVRLPRPVPVYVFYWTVLPDEQGQVGFRQDVYGWDRTLMAAL